MFIFSNLATSIDGKIATATREHFPLGTPADRALMLRLRARADAVIIGAGTLRAYGRPILARGSKQPLNIVVSSKLEGLSPKLPFFTDKRTRKLVFVSQPVSPARCARFSSVMGDSGTILRLPRSAIQSGESAIAITQQLSAMGIRRLLVEGGGGLMWDFVKHSLLDEIYLTLTPRILGGWDAPTLVDGEGFTSKTSAQFHLKRCRRLGDELYLVYAKILKKRSK